MVRKCPENKIMILVHQIKVEISFVLDIRCITAGCDLYAINESI